MNPLLSSDLFTQQSPAPPGTANVLPALCGREGRAPRVDILRISGGYGKTFQAICRIFKDNLFVAPESKSLQINESCKIIGKRKG